MADAIEIKVCTRCKKGKTLFAALQPLSALHYLGRNVEIISMECLRLCESGPGVLIKYDEHNIYYFGMPLSSCHIRPLGNDPHATIRDFLENYQRSP